MDFDEHWLRLAIAIHECSTSAMKNVLDNVISAKHADLQSKPFKEKLQQALVRDEAQLRHCLLKYEVPQVFPPVPCVYPAPYESLDIGMVAKLVKYYAGNAVWQASTANLPDIENLSSFDFATASAFALVELLREFRNWVFHNTGSPPLTSEGFSYLWDGLMNVLGGLGYDISRVNSFKAGALGIGSQRVVAAIMEEREILLKQINVELMADKDAILKLQSEMASKDELKNVFEKFEAGIQKGIGSENNGAAPRQSASFWQSSMPGWFRRWRMRENTAAEAFKDLVRDGNELFFF